MTLNLRHRNKAKEYIPVYFVLLILILLIYHQVHSFDFLSAWDDQWFVTNEYTEGGLQFDNIYLIFTEFYRGQYAPLNQLYYTLLYSLFGYHTGYFHIASMVLYLLNAILAYHLVRMICKRSLPNKMNQVTGILTACLFAILPINVEPVAWVSSSKVLIYALFYFISLLFYLKYIESKRARYYYVVILTYIFSFFGKEQAC